MPASHWIGSEKSASIGSNAASNAAASPKGMETNPGVNGPKSLRIHGLRRRSHDGRGAPVEIVFANDDLRLAGRDAFFVYPHRRAALMAVSHSLRSVFIGGTISIRHSGRSLQNSGS